MRAYSDPDEDNARWDGFAFRRGDIVIAAPSKSGTTWTQLLVALLVFDGPVFPDQVGKMSVWMEWAVRPVGEAHGILGMQQHRRFVKSHTPLDGIPLDDNVRYVCVGRDPRDAAVSMVHHSENINRPRMAELIGTDMPKPPGTLEERIDRWLERGDWPAFSVRSVSDHYRTFWDHRGLENVELFHFADYVNDLPSEIQRLGDHLGIKVTSARAKELAAEASIEQARARADELVPDAHLGIFHDNSAFMRAGRVGDGISAMSPSQLDRYERLMSDLVPNDLADWIHHGRSGA